MPRLWCPGAVVVPAPNGKISTHDGGSMLGPDSLVACVWHTYEAGYGLSAVAGAKGLIADGNELHLTFNPVQGGIAQVMPADRAGRGLVNLPGGVQTNRLGKFRVQIEVIARASRPWTQDLTEAGHRDLDKIVSWLRDDLGIPDAWPDGPPPAYPLPRGVTADRDVHTWLTHSGHYGHVNAPENDHEDPGAIDIRVITAAGRSQPVTKTPDGRLITQADLRWMPAWGSRVGVGVHALSDGGRAEGDAELQLLRGVFPGQKWIGVEQRHLTDGAAVFDLAKYGLHPGDWHVRVAYHPAVSRWAPAASPAVVVPLG